MTVTEGRGSLELPTVGTLAADFMTVGPPSEGDGASIPEMPSAPVPRPRPAPALSGATTITTPNTTQVGDAPRTTVSTVTRVGLLVLAAVSFSLVGQIVVVSGVEHRAAQQRIFDGFRKQLAEGTAPLGQTDQSGRLLRIGTPVALLEIPSLKVHEVVVEGTSSGVLTSGPGHRRDTPLPGQAGTSVVFGRQASYGGPFRGLHNLRVGAKIVVTTGEGKSVFQVIDVRRAGAPIPKQLAAGKGRLQLVTAVGTPFVPSGVLRVDADLVTPALGAPPTAITAGSLAPSEGAMAVDTTTVWTLVLWLQLLVVVAVGAVLSWARWGHHQTWVVFFPLIALVGLFANGQFLKLLPNLL